MGGYASDGGSNSGNDDCSGSSLEDYVMSGGDCDEGCSSDCDRNSDVS